MDSTVSALMYLTPFSLLGCVLGPLVGKAAPRVGYRLVLRIGLAGSLVLFILMYVGLTSKWMLFVLAFLMGATYAAMSNTVLNATGILYSDPSRPGVLPGLNSAAFNMGASVGIGLMASLLVRNANTPTPEAGYSQALIVGIVFGALALVSSLAMPERVTEDEKV